MDNYYLHFFVDILVANIKKSMVRKDFSVHSLCNLLTHWRAAAGWLQRTAARKGRSSFPPPHVAARSLPPSVLHTRPPAQVSPTKQLKFYHWKKTKN